MCVVFLIFCIFVLKNDYFFEFDLCFKNQNKNENKTRKNIANQENKTLKTHMEKHSTHKARSSAYILDQCMLTWVCERICKYMHAIAIHGI